MKDILLLGGAGFLGVGLQKELSKRNIGFKSVDLDAIDLAGNPERVVPLLGKLFSEYDNIVMLASKLGAKLFESEDAICAAVSNKQMNENVLTALELTAKKLNKKFDFTYYSTSEVFGSMQSANDFITDNSLYKFDYNNKRHLYAYCKYEAELRLEKMLSVGILSSLKILRPFNIYGCNLRRGVLYDMINSALTEHIIYYSDDTTRTLTDINYASKVAADAILDIKNICLNIADPSNSLTMEALANIVNEVLGLDCKLVKLHPDNSIRYRTVSKVNDNILLSKKIMTPYIIDLASLFKK